MLYNDTSNVTHGRGYVYSLQYHIVWCTKYRKPVLLDDLAKECMQILQDTANDLNFKIVAVEVMPDHIHLLADCKPHLYLPDAIKVLKGNTARRLFLRYPELKQQLWDGHLWNPSYFVVTVSERTERDVTNYINSQKQK